MEQISRHQTVVEKLYALYLEKGFLREEEALDLMSANGITLVGINRVTDRLVALGVIFSDDSNIDDDEYTDRAQMNYESLFREVLDISPEQKSLINYIREVRPPQNREWQSLITQMNSGNEYAFNRLFDMYLRVVVRIALRFYKDSGFELDDAIQEGSMGLIRAIKQYDGSKHGNLGSYLPLWIQQYINRAIADKGRTIRIPVHAFELIQKIRKNQIILSDQNGREPSLAEIAAISEMTCDAVMKLLEATRETVSLDNMIETECGQMALDKFYSTISFDEDIDRNILIEQVQKVLSTLTDREQHIMTLRYGLSDGRERTLEEVGGVFSVTRERIRQIEAKALKKLRHRSRAQYIKDFF